MSKTGRAILQASKHAGATGKPEGLDGWLLLPLAHLMLNTLYTIRAFEPISNIPVWVTAVYTGVALDPGLLAPYVLALSLSYVALVLISGFALYLMFKKSARLRKVMTGFYLFNIVVSIEATAVGWFWERAYSEAAGMTTAPMSALWRSAPFVAFAVIWAAIWIPYFWRSKRLANTFG